MRAPILIAIVVLVACLPATAGIDIRDSLHPQCIDGMRVNLNPWGPHLDFEKEFAGDDPGIEALLAVIRQAQPGGGHKCANAGAIRFRMKDGGAVGVGLLPSHTAGLYGLRMYDGDAFLAAYTVDRVALLNALGRLGLPMDDPAFQGVRPAALDKTERSGDTSGMADKFFAEQVFRVRHDHAAVFPPRNQIHKFVDDLMDVIFPHLSGEPECDTAEEIAARLDTLQRDLVILLEGQADRLEPGPEAISEQFFAHLPTIYTKLWLDAQAIHEGDPASESIDEVISAYPGFFAIYTYRIAHHLYRQQVPILPRIFTEYAHVRTGIDIHPGASIGDRFCIDHGTGVVIGETTVIGDNVKVYQGVSLGALSVSKELAGAKRHPTVEDNVVIYSSATILGGKTVVGHDSVIGGNVWITESVPPHSVVYHKSEVRVQTKRMQKEPIDFSI